MNTEVYRNVFFPAFLWTWNLISLLNGETQTERIQGHSGEEDIETQDRGSDRKLEKTSSHQTLRIRLMREHKMNGFGVKIKANKLL